MVIKATSYDILIGNDWLTKVRAIIDMDARQMQIRWKGRKYLIPLDLERGIRPQMAEDNEDEEL